MCWLDGCDIRRGCWQSRSSEIFADGFRGDDGVIHRPVGVAEGPDGLLYAIDDRAGRVYRIIYYFGN